MLLKNILAYSGVNLFSQVLTLGQNLVVRGLLAPPVMGIWNYVGVVQGFLGTFDIGINAAAIRELPLLHGQGRLEEEAQARATAFWSSLAQGLLFMTLILGYLVWGWQSLEYKISLLVAALLVVTNSLKDCLTTFLQGAQQYVPLSRVQFLTVILHASALCLGAYFGGIYGLMLGAVLVQFCLAAMLLTTCLGQGLGIGYPWNRQIFGRLAGFGLPLRLVDYPLSLFLMLDVLCVTKFLPVSALALYATGRMISLSANELISRMGTVIITRINERGVAPAGRALVAEELRLFLLFEYLVLLPALIFPAFFVSSFLIGRFIPKYYLAVEVTRILLISLFFVPQTTLVRNFWILDKRLLSLGISNIVGFLAGVSALALAVWTLGLSLVTVAWAMVAGLIIYFCYIQLSVGRETWGLLTACQVGLASLGAATYTAVILHFMNQDFLNLSFLEGLQLAGLRIMAALLCLCPLFLLGAWVVLRSKTVKIPALLFLRRDKRS